jgi:ribose transport system ATP-binding protein
MHDGNVTAELSREEATQESIMHAAVAGPEVVAAENGG